MPVPPEDSSDSDPALASEADDSFRVQLLARLADRGSPSSRYRSEGEFAHGGMGSILRVWDEDLRRELAMKVMRARRRPAASDDRSFARFLEEAQITGQLDHPGIVPVHELGLDAEGQLYFTMKLVKGRDLKAIFDLVHSGAEGWTLLKAVNVLLRVCEAMAYAHSKGVIHRDLKPANVMVGRYGEVYVMDWGLARILGKEDTRDLRIHSDAASAEVHSDRRDLAEETPDSPLFTMDGDVVGTPAYMPPEQASGRLEEIGPHSDVYAVGAMLYHLLAGHSPYVPPGVRLNRHAIWFRVQEGPPPPLAETAPDAPAELVAICEKATARDIEQRYPDTAALAEDLSAYVEGRVVHSYEEGALAEARKWIQRNRALAGSLALALVLGVGGLFGISHVRAEEELQRERADAIDREAKQERALLRSIADVRLLADLERQADELWPPYPERIDDLDAWVGSARELVGRREQHELQLARVRGTLASGGSDPADHLRGIPEYEWLEGTLQGLIGDVDRFSAGLLGDGILAGAGWSVPRRLDFALELEETFAAGGWYSEPWAEALPEIHRTYPGLTLTPQMGLVPIGPDPGSGLWEFAHLVSGDPAERGSDGRLSLEESTGIVLVLLPGGPFWRGAQTDPAGPNHDPQADATAGPVHRIVLEPFFLSKYEVTQAQWLRLAGHNPSLYLPGSEVPVTLLHPVEQVSWYECVEVLHRGGLALPSEDQWEFGTRAGTEFPWWTGEHSSSLRRMRAANLGAEGWTDDGYEGHAPVGTFAANGFGLHDVAGNVHEWCADPWDGTPHRLDTPKEAIKDRSTRAIRGGSYAEGPYFARSACRLIMGAPSAESHVGVRPARAIEP